MESPHRHIHRDASRSALAAPQSRPINRSRQLNRSMALMFFFASVVAAPFLAGALTRRGIVNRGTGYAVGMALILVGALVLKQAGGGFVR